MPASPDPELALQLAKTIVDIYGEASGRMLHMVARRLGHGIDSPGWQERKLIEITNLRNEAVRELERLQATSGKAITEAVEAGYARGVKDATADLRSLGDPIRVPTGLEQQRAVQALARETIERVHSTHFQILRNTTDNYRNIISEVASGPLTGTETRRQATQRALNRFAAKGIKGFTDKAGRGWELESYAEMATRTSVGRAQTGGTLDRFVEAGRDLVIVSDAPQECRVCRPWEGKVLSISGASLGKKLASGFSVAGTVGEATSAGLHHANCRHSLAAYIDGVTRPHTNTEDPEGDAQRQQQRALERNVRKWKRVAGAKLPEHHELRSMQKAAEDHLRGAQKALRDHVQKHDLKRLYYREQVGKAR